VIVKLIRLGLEILSRCLNLGIILTSVAIIVLKIEKIFLTQSPSYVIRSSLTQLSKYRSDQLMAYLSLLQ